MKIAPIPKSSPLVGLMLLALVTWMMCADSYRGMVESNVRGGDFHFFYQAAQRLNAHQPLYIFEDKGQTYVYPPLFAMLLRPVAGPSSIEPGIDNKLTPQADAEFLRAQKAWFWCSAGCILLAALFFSLAMRFTLHHSAAIALALLTAFHFWPTVMTFGLGQTNLLCLAALAGMFYADRSNKLHIAAICVVACALVKTWFVGMILYFILRRAWKHLALTVALGLFCTALLFTLVGWNELPTFLTLTKNYAAGTGTQVLSQSIAGFAMLHFGPHIHIDPLIESNALVALFKYSGDALILAALAFLFLKPQPSAPYDRLLRLSLLSLSILLLLPYSQNEYLVMALPAIWLLLLSPIDAGILPCLIAALCYAVLTRGGPYYPNDAKAFQHGLATLRVSLPFYALFMLWATTLLVILRRRKMLHALPSSRAPSRQTAPLQSS